MGSSGSTMSISPPAIRLEVPVAMSAPSLRWVTETLARPGDEPLENAGSNATLYLWSTLGTYSPDSSHDQSSPQSTRTVQDRGWSSWAPAISSGSERITKEAAARTANPRGMPIS